MAKFKLFFTEAEINKLHKNTSVALGLGEHGIPKEVERFIWHISTGGIMNTHGNRSDCRPRKLKKPNDCIICAALYLKKKYPAPSPGAKE